MLSLDAAPSLLCVAKNSAPSTIAAPKLSVAPNVSYKQADINQVMKSSRNGETDKYIQHNSRQGHDLASERKTNTRAKQMHTIYKRTWEPSKKGEI